MKKNFIVILLLSMPLTIFASDFAFSLGGGGFAGYTFTRYTLSGDDLSGKFVESKQSMDRANYGGFIFFDFTYAELSVMYQGGNSKYAESVQYPDGSYLTNDKGIGKESSIGISLMGKYPFTITEKIKLFPMLGVEYHFTLAQKRNPDEDNDDYWYNREDGDLVADRDKDDKPYKLSAWNPIWVNIGAGADFFLTNSLFLRGEFTFGFRMPTAYEMGALEVVKQYPTNIKDPKMGGLTGTPSLKIALGYRF